MHDYAYPFIGIYKHGMLNQIANGLQFNKQLSTKLLTVLICQTILPPQHFTVRYIKASDFVHTPAILYTNS